MILARVFSILTIVTLNNLVILHGEPTCYDSSKENTNLHLATKTPYRFISNYNDSVVTYPGCHPRRIWSVIRHGTRNPKRKIIDAINIKLTNIRNEIIERRNPKLCPQDIERLRSWESQINVDEEKHLTYEGNDELLQLAERVQNRFPSILPEQFDESSYKFKFTDSQRTWKSFESFASGLFGRNNLSKVLHAPPTKRDPILRFYKLCSKWAVDVDDNPDAAHEPNEWLKSDEMNNLMQEMRQKLDLPSLSKELRETSAFALTKLLQGSDNRWRCFSRGVSRDIVLMYTACGFETAWYKFNSSPWCSIFTENQLKILEFYFDLKHYWNDGYGFEINKMQACPALKDMVDHLDLNSNHPNSTFYFTHSGALLKILAHLGLYRDDFTLTHKDFGKNREWRVGKIDAFASNLVFVSFECSSEPYVLVMHQEQIVTLPGCPSDTDLCSLATIRKTFEGSLNECDFDDLCENAKSVAP